MNFLGLGPGELMLIAVLGLIIFGPGRLPEIAAQVGRAVRDLRRSTAEVTREFQDAMQPLQEVADLPKAIGAGAVFAQNGAAPSQGAAESATAPEPPLADTSEWHWETASETPANGHDAAAEGPVAASFWDWETPAPVAAPEPGPATAAAESTAPAASASIWEWDGPASVQQARQTASADESR